MKDKDRTPFFRQLYGADRPEEELERKLRQLEEEISRLKSELARVKQQPKGTRLFGSEMGPMDLVPLDSLDPNHDTAPQDSYGDPIDGPGEEERTPIDPVEYIDPLQFEPTDPVWADILGYDLPDGMGAEPSPNGSWDPSSDDTARIERMDTTEMRRVSEEELRPDPDYRWEHVPLTERPTEIVQQPEEIKEMLREHLEEQEELVPTPRPVEEVPAPRRTELFQGTVPAVGGEPPAPVPKRRRTTTHSTKLYEAMPPTPDPEAREVSGRPSGPVLEVEEGTPEEIERVLEELKRELEEEEGSLEDTVVAPNPFLEERIEEDTGPGVQPPEDEAYVPAREDEEVSSGEVVVEAMTPGPVVEGAEDEKEDSPSLQERDVGHENPQAEDLEEEGNPAVPEDVSVPVEGKEAPEEAGTPAPDGDVGQAPEEEGREEDQPSAQGAETAGDDVGPSTVAEEPGATEDGPVSVDEGTDGDEELLAKEPPDGIGPEDGASLQEPDERNLEPGEDTREAPEDGDDAVAVAEPSEGPQAGEDSPGLAMSEEDTGEKDASEPAGGERSGGDADGLPEEGSAPEASGEGADVPAPQESGLFEEDSVEASEEAQDESAGELPPEEASLEDGADLKEGAPEGAQAEGDEGGEPGEAVQGAQDEAPQDVAAWEGTEKEEKWFTDGEEEAEKASKGPSGSEVVVEPVPSTLGRRHAILMWVGGALLFMLSSVLMGFTIAMFIVGHERAQAPKAEPRPAEPKPAASAQNPRGAPDSTATAEATSVAKAPPPKPKVIRKIRPIDWSKFAPREMKMLEVPPPDYSEGAMARMSEDATAQPAPAVQLAMSPEEVHTTNRVLRNLLLTPHKVEPGCPRCVKEANRLMDRGRYRRAARLYRRSLQLREDDNETRVKLAFAYHAMGRDKAALREVMRVLKSDPFHPRALLLAAISHQFMHEMAEALKYYKLYLKQKREDTFKAEVEVIVSSIEKVVNGRPHTPRPTPGTVPQPQSPMAVPAPSYQEPAPAPSQQEEDPSELLLKKLL